MRIVVDDLTGPEIAALLEAHTAELRSISPPESKHALDLRRCPSFGHAVERRQRQLQV